MAKRVHRRRNSKGRFVKGGHSSNPPRRRRRRHHKNPPAAHAKRRRRRNPGAGVMRRNSHHRRRHRRNPPRHSIGGIVGTVAEAAVGGLGVVLGETLARKARGGLQGVVTTKANVSTGLPGLGTTVGAAIAGTIVHGMIPKKFRGGAFGDAAVLGLWAEAISFGLALTPAAPYLSAFPQRPALRIVDRTKFAAYARSRGNLRAFPVDTGTTFGAYTRAMGVPSNAGMGGTGY